MTPHVPSGRPANAAPVDFDPFAAPDSPVALPLTDAQQEVWAACQLDPLASAAYNQCFAFRLRGPLSIDSMREAFGRLPARHQALRLTFAETGDRQQIAPATSIPFTLVDASACASVGDDALAALIARESAQPFDLVRGPLARAWIVRETGESHVVVFTAHHLVCDGQSSGLLLHDLAELYNADRHGRVAWPADVASYDAYVRAATAPSARETATDEYWSRLRDRVPPPLELPTDRSRPPHRAFRAGQTRITIGGDLYRDVRALAARQKSTLYVSLLAAWQTLLYRLTSQTELAVGIPVAGPLADERLVGHSVHMLPVVARLDPSASFDAHVTATRRALAEVHEHRAMTFGRLVRLLNLPRDAARTPLFSVVFNVDRPAEPPSFDRLALEPVASAKAGVTFELALDIADTGDELHVECNYASELFEASTVERWLEYYRVLLTSVAADSTVRLDRVAIMPGEERTAVLAASRAASTSDEVRCLHEMFEAAAAENPQAIAVSCEEDARSYDALNRRANRIAHHLRSLGVGAESLVGICVDASIDLVAAIVGVLKAGAAYVPIDPESPAARTRLVLEDAGCRVVVTTERRRDRFDNVDCRIVSLDGDAAALARAGDGNPRVRVTPAQLAYVIFTSGSTGRPKGVAVTHANVSRLFSATAPWFRFGAGDVWTLFHSAAFDFSVWELWGPLLHGGRLVVVPYWVARSPEALHELLRRERVTVLNQTPSAFKQLTEFDRTVAGQPLALRLIVFGGEALDLAALRPWVERHGDELPALVNMYGITETTVHVTYRRIRADDVWTGSGSPIGAAIPDLDLFLLSPGAGELVPIGVAGEIHVGGPGLARGYVFQPELSADRFVPNPFGGAGERLYRSGDLARRRANGDIEYLGRIDQQVKIRGFRIELGEIAAALRTHPDVGDATVVMAPGAHGEPQLVAYAVLRSGGTGDAAGLLAHVRGRLPDYMVPRAFVFLDALPMTENGKLDRARLPLPSAAVHAARAAVAPRTDTERAIADIWRDALGVSEVGVTDSFFDLGGHSMTAVTVVARLKERFAVALSVAALFHAPTVAGLAEMVDMLAAQASRRVSGEREVIEL
ncbi:MAG TPA: amino acid adenylation domain-containing protein [Vicinamibacterales bacterium]|nr:amino acid adenylation domain-containing protein [Vicinamibacterales bacterium]